MSNLKEVLDKLKKNVKEIVKNEVSEVVKDTMKEHIKTDVYSTYTPSEYIRRYEDGGLLDDKNIKSKIKSTEDNIELSVTNETKGIKEEDGLYFDTNKRLDKVIEYGVGYEWTKSKIYQNQPYPRPFVHNTKEELERTKKCNEVLKEKLKNKGYNLK